MAVDFTASTLISGYNMALLQQMFDDIETALADAVSRSGNTPNTMSADLDMNGNGILNASSLGSSLSTYADNTAAVAGGLSVGDFYKTATGEVRVVVA